MRDRSIRRHYSQVAKDKAFFIGKYVWKKFTEPYKRVEDEDIPKVIGIDASTHCCPCSCSMCGNPRRSAWYTKKGKLTRQELKAQVSEEEQLLDI